VFSQAPDATSVPQISGSPVVGGALTCSQGAWSGTMPQSYRHQWLLDGTPIAAATTAVYTILSADAGHALSCKVTASNLGGSAIATSAPVNVPAPPPPVAADAGPDQTITLPGTATLSGSVTSAAGGQWSEDSGPGVVAFAPSDTALGATASFSAAGTYVLRLSTTGPAGASDTVTITVKAAPVTLTKLSISPTTFAAAPQNTPVATAAKGATVRWTLSRGATTTIAFTKQTTRPPRRGARRPIRRLTRNGKAGANSLRFTAKIAGSTLTPGTWKLTITARDSDGNTTTPQTRTFRIVKG
jgi:hypothetical protein